MFQNTNLQHLFKNRKNLTDFLAKSKPDCLFKTHRATFISKFL